MAGAGPDKVAGSPAYANITPPTPRRNPRQGVQHGLVGAIQSAKKCHLGDDATRVLRGGGRLVELLVVSPWHIKGGPWSPADGKGPWYSTLAYLDLGFILGSLLGVPRGPS